MSKARLVLTALLLDRQTPVEVAARYGVHRSWVYKLKARYETDVEAAFGARSRHPKTSPTAIPPATVTLITELRDKLTTAGLDAGPDTIAWHLRHHHGRTVSASTISRYLTRAGLVTPTPTKRPKSSYHRFAATLPNETWQADFTHDRLTQPNGTPGPDAEVLTWLDDHSRYALDVTAHQPVTSPIVRDRFLATVARFGPPASTLTTTRWSSPPAYRRQGRPQRPGGRTPTPRRDPEELQPQPPHHLRQGRTLPTDPQEVARRPTHPTQHRRGAAGPARRVHPRVQPSPAAPVPAAPGHPRDRLRHPPQGPTHHQPRRRPHDRVRYDRIDNSGCVTLRVAGRLHHLGVGRTHARTHVILLVQDLHVRVVNAATGELLRELVLDPTKDYQPTGAPKGPTRKQPARTHDRGFGLSPIS